MCHSLASDEFNTGSLPSCEQDAMVHPADGTDTSIPLKCVDDERVWIGSAHINRCQLIESLPSLPDEIAVPFTEDEVSTWCTYWDDQRSSSDVGFLECVSILKVLCRISCYLPDRIKAFATLYN